MVGSSGYGVVVSPVSIPLHGDVDRAVGGLGICIGLCLRASTVAATGTPRIKALEAGLQGIRVILSEINFQYRSALPVGCRCRVYVLVGDFVAVEP